MSETPEIYGDPQPRRETVAELEAELAAELAAANARFQRVVSVMWDQFGSQVCMDCGCSDNDACVDDTHAEGRCRWAEVDLCTVCARKREAREGSDAA